MKLFKKARITAFSAIVLISALVLVAEMLLPESVVDLFAARADLKFLMPLTLITYMFMHSGFNHFFFNMFFTAPFAIAHEKRVGARRFLRDYLVSGVVAAVFFMQMPSLFGSPALIGASGACSGIMALGCLGFKGSRSQEILALLGLIGLFMASFIPGLYDCLIPSGVAHMAHVGGILAGVVLFCSDRFTNEAAPTRR